MNKFVQVEWHDEKEDPAPRSDSYAFCELLIIARLTEFPDSSGCVMTGFKHGQEPFAKEPDPDDGMWFSDRGTKLDPGTWTILYWAWFPDGPNGE